MAPTMLPVTYPGPHAQVEVPDLGVVVDRGETVDAPPELARVLVAQGWEPAGWGGSDEVPDLVDDVKAWVGDDPAKAQAALAAEQARSKPRSTLVAHLENVFLQAEKTDPGDGIVKEGIEAQLGEEAELVSETPDGDAVGITDEQQEG